MTAREQHELTVAKLSAQDADRAKMQFAIDSHIQRWLSWKAHRTTRIKMRHDRWKRWNNRYSR
jgi:hypothetical protein